MIKLTSTLTIILIFTVLCNAISLQAMEKIIATNEYEQYLRRSAKIKAEKAEEYNQHDGLTALHNDIFNYMLPYCHTNNNAEAEALEESIKTFMRLRIVCKKFNTLLTFETIGTLCHNYAPHIKSQTFRKLIKPTYDPHDKIKHLPALIVLCAGTDINTEIELNDLLFEAVRSNDIQVTTALFKYHAHPHIQNESGPIFFHAKTVEMAQLFIANKVNVHMVSSWPKTNIFWEIIKNEYPSELMALYLAHNVDAKKLRPSDNACLLHRLASLPVNMDDNFFEKAQLLLNAAPDMINTINNKNKTPLDIAQEELEKAKKDGSSETIEKLIALFKEYSGKTTQELTQQTASLEQM